MDDARGYLREFVRETLRDSHGAMQRHSLDYDLYLPWLHEDVWSAPAPNGTHPRFPDLDRLFMDAAWSLVQDGYLRPGPRKISSESRPNDYGKGFTLTPPGFRWLNQD